MASDTDTPTTRPARLDTGPSVRVATSEIELVLDEEPLHDDVTNVEIAVVPALDLDAQAVIAACDAELATEPPPHRAARLHFEIARAYDGAGLTEQAATHYLKALVDAPDHLPTIRGARRTQIQRSQFASAALLFDAEERLTPSPKRKAMLLYAKGRLLEDRLDDRAGAREIYTRALRLDPVSLSVLAAIEQCDRRAGNVSGLLETLEQTANNVSADARHRAVLLVERARWIERSTKPDAPAAGLPEPAELYEAALRLDPNAFGTLESLERIYRREQAWRSLVGVLERRSRQTTDAARRSFALYEAARIHAERLGNRSEAVAALDKAAAVSPDDRLVLEDLARVYEQVEDFGALAAVLAALGELAVDPAERVALLHRVGQVYEGPLDEPELAIKQYTAALALEPTHLPVLQALGRLLASRNQWEALVEMHLAEARATQIATRAAAAHARVAEVFEVHLRDPAAAAVHHVQALARVANYPASLKALARLYAQLARYRELVELFERAVADTSQRALKIAYLMKIGSLWEDALGDPVQALGVFRRILELDPNDLVAIHAIQRVAENSERYAQLADAIELEIELVDDPNLRVGLLHRVGTVFDEYLNDQDAALVRFRRALELQPGFVPALASLGRIYHRCGRWSELLEIYAREVEVTPTTSEKVALLYKMGELCEQKLGDGSTPGSPAAVGWYLRAVELDPSHRPSIRALVRKQREKADWAALVITLEQEVAAIGKDQSESLAIAWYRIGHVYEERLGNPDKAIDAYRRALESVSGYWPARTALFRLQASQGQWHELVEPLHQEALSTEHAMHSIAAVMQLGELYRDKLDNRELAIQRFASIGDEAGVIPALLALEPLYRAAGAWDKLLDVYKLLGRKLAEPGARIAAMREAARLQELHKLGPRTDRAATYEAIIALDAGDDAALAALEDIGRAMRDDRFLAGVYRRASEIAEDDDTAASALVGLGESFERLGDRRALDAYRAAVKKDASMLTAIRGLARVGDLRGDPRAMAEAARLEAALTRKPELAAKLHVRAGILRQEQMNDLGAVEDYERALDVWPDDVEGAERIIQPLVDTGQVQRLVDILSKSALAAKSAERKTHLWLEVGALYTTRLDNLGAGITAYRRALDAAPGNIVALGRLAKAYQKNQQWGDAVATLEQLLTLTSDKAERANAHLELAAIFDENLGNIERASRSVQAVLREDPKHTAALLRLADIQLRSGDDAEAVKTTQRLVELADSPKQKGAALVRVGRLQRTRGETAAADSAFGEALALEGPGGDAERELKQTLGKNLISYAAGLANFIVRTEPDRDPPTLIARATAYLDLATAYAENMNMPSRAVDTLVEGLEATGDHRLGIALARRLRDSGRHQEAANHLKRSIERDPVRSESWRELALVFEHAGRKDDAQRAMDALGVLGAPIDRARSTPRPACAAEGSFDAKMMAAIADANATTEPSAILLATIADTIGKLYPPSLERFGLTSRDRVGPRSNSPLWEPASRTAKIFGAEFELYEHGAAEPVIAIEPFETPALVVSQAVRKLPLAQQVFVLAHCLGPIASRRHAAISLSTAQLETILVGVARTVSPSFELRKGPDDEIEDVKETVRKHIPRKWRKQMEVAAAELIANPPTDFAAWHSALRRTTARAALLVADDLQASIIALGYVTELAPAKGAVLVQSSEEVRDLMRFWISNRASTTRARTGIVAG